VTDLKDCFLSSGGELVPHSDTPNGDPYPRSGVPVNPWRLSYESSDVNLGGAPPSLKTSPDPPDIETSEYGSQSTIS